MDCNCCIMMAPTRRARSYPKAGVSFALLRSASALKTTASVGSTARALKCHWWGGKKPGPTERLASAERLNRNEAFSRNVCRFQSDFTVMNQIKMLRIVTFLKNLLAGPEALNDSAFNQQRKILRRKVIPKRMLGENIFESLNIFESFHRYFKVFFLFN